MPVIEAEFTEPTNNHSTVALLRSCEPIGPFRVNFTLTMGTSNKNNTLWRASAKAEVDPTNFEEVLLNRDAQEVVRIVVDSLNLDLGEVSVENA